MVPTPDGMGADHHRERQNMKEARNTPTPSHDIVACDSDNNDLYIAESAWTENAAESECEACQNLLEYDSERFPEVSYFRVRER